MSLDLLESVQKILAVKAERRSKPRKDHFVYLLSGILKADDGTFFRGESAKSGRNPYYFNKKLGIRIRKENIEEVVCHRIKEYLTKSGTLESVLKSTLKHSLTGLPFIEEEIGDYETKIASLEKIAGEFSETLRKAALENPEKLSQICTVLFEEKRKTEGELEDLRTKKQEAMLRKEKLAKQFRGETIQNYIRRAFDHLDQKTDLQKRMMIQAIIPQIIFHPAERKLEMRINPDPRGKSSEIQKSEASHSCHTAEEKVRLIDVWRGGRDLNPRPLA